MIPNLTVIVAIYVVCRMFDMLCKPKHMRTNSYTQWIIQGLCTIGIVFVVLLTISTLRSAIDLTTPKEDGVDKWLRELHEKNNQESLDKSFQDMNNSLDRYRNRNR